MDRKMRQSMIDSYERNVRMCSVVDADHTAYVTVGRPELRTLLMAACTDYRLRARCVAA